MVLLGGRESVRQRQKEHNLTSRIAARAPALSRVQQETMLHFAREHRSLRIKATDIVY